MKEPNELSHELGRGEGKAFCAHAGEHYVGHIAPVSNSCRKFAMALAACLCQELVAADFAVSGQQELQVVLNSTTSAVFTTTFNLTCVGSNWAFSTVYTNSGVREWIAV